MQEESNQKNLFDDVQEEKDIVQEEKDKKND